MTVPSREEAARLLRSLDPPAWHVRHARAVAEIAAWLALRVERRERGDGTSRAALRPRVRPRLDRGLVEAAALLHDVDKAVERRSRGAGRHGEAGAEWLAGQGYPELAEAVALHPVTLLVDPDGTSRVLRASREALIVAYADKRAGQRLEPMASRFATWQRRHRHSRGEADWSQAAADHAWDAARTLEGRVCALAGCRPDEVGRLRWTARALRDARRQAAVPG